MTAQLPAIQVVLPLFAAILASLVRRGWAAWAIALAVSLAMPVIAFALLYQVLETGPISYAMGGWEPPFGIEYRVDLLSAFMLVLISVPAAIITSASPRRMRAAASATACTPEEQKRLMV